MVFLFTSNHRVRYLQDALNVLALPHNSIFHFRYSKKWVDKVFLDEDQLSITKLQEVKGSEAAVVYVSQPKKEEDRKPENVHFYPLRKAQIFDTVVDGTILHVYFEIGEYIKLRPANNYEYDIFLREQFDSNNTPPDKYISVSRKDSEQIFEFAEKKEEATAWEEIVNRISSSEKFPTTTFYRMSGFDEIKKEGPLPNIPWPWNWLSHWTENNLKIEKLLPRESGYKLNGVTEHYLDLSFYQPKSQRTMVQGAEIEVTVNTEHFRHRPPPIFVSSGYDKYQIPLNTRNISEDVKTRLRVGLRAAGDGNVNRVEMAPILDVLLELNYPKLRINLGFVGLFFAQLMIVFAANFDGIMKTISDQDGVSWPGIIKSFFGILGPTFTTLILWWLYKKAPGT